MKHKLRILCLLLALSLLLGTGALAVSYDAVSPGGTAAAGALPVASGCSVELKFQSDDTLLLTYRDARIAAGDQMLLMLVSCKTGSDGTPQHGSYTPTASSLTYLDQKAAEKGIVSFTLKPGAMTNATLVLSGTHVPKTDVAGVKVSVLSGDVDGSGAVDILDVQTLLRYLVGSESLSAAGLLAADTNHDSTVDILDAQELLASLVS